jgi:hypothetical protein
MKCPKCDSDNVESIDYMGVECVICHDCGYDGREQYDIAPDEGQRPAKDRWTPYKIGGHARTQKRK